MTPRLKEHNIHHFKTNRRPVVVGAASTPNVFYWCEQATADE